MKIEKVNIRFGMLLMMILAAAFSRIIPHSPNISGLTACYLAGIPFFWNTLAGDLFYSALLFGTFELAKMKFPKLAV